MSTGFYLLLAHLLTCSSIANGSKPLNVLTFGDSQATQGPTWRTLQDVLETHNVTANVVNKARGGTRACGWAKHVDAMVTAAREAFPNATDGPDLVWYTAGGNDLAQDLQYHACTLVAATEDAIQSCIGKANARLMACSVSLFERLWDVFPNAKIGQYNYMATCMHGECLIEAASYLGGPFCFEKRHSHGSPTACMLSLLEYWQSIYVDALQRRFPAPRYTGMNLLGAVQHASGIPGASTGHMNVSGGGARCSWMHNCVHPMYGTPAAQAIGQAMWMLWLEPILNKQPSLAPEAGVGSAVVASWTNLNSATAPAAASAPPESTAVEDAEELPRQSHEVLDMVETDAGYSVP